MQCDEYEATSNRRRTVLKPLHWIGRYVLSLSIGGVSPLKMRLVQQLELLQSECKAAQHQDCRLTSLLRSTFSALSSFPLSSPQWARSSGLSTIDTDERETIDLLVYRYVPGRTPLCRLPHPLCQRDDGRDRSFTECMITLTGPLQVTGLNPLLMQELNTGQHALCFFLSTIGSVVGPTNRVCCVRC